MKIWTQGRWLWTRTIGSTIAGEGVDSLIFYPMAFAGLWTAETLVAVIAFNWIFKVAIEVLATPITYKVVAVLKARGGRRFLRSRNGLQSVLARVGRVRSPPSSGFAVDSLPRAPHG